MSMRSVKNISRNHNLTMLLLVGVILTLFTYSNIQAETFDHNSSNLDKILNNKENFGFDYIVGVGDIAISSSDTGGYIGDINLNGIPFEPADADLYANYFIYGLSVFTINIAGQIAASDVNGDGISLSFEDYLYMIRRIMNTPQPTPWPTEDTAFFQLDPINKVVRMHYSNPVNIFMQFNGDVTPVGHESSNYPWDTLIDIHIYQNPSNYENDSLFYYTGEGTLVTAVVLYENFTPIITNIIGGGASCCLLRGDINNSFDDEVNITDLTYMVDFMFRNGPRPPCFEQADINADWQLGITDLTVLVDFMFRGGAVLPSCQ